MRLDLTGVGVRLDGRPIVTDVDLAVGPGSFTALVGPNGSGKSTLLRTVYRGLRPCAGTVLLDGDDTWRLPAREAARRRAVVTQHQVAVPELTVREVAAMGRSPHKGLLDRETGADRRIVAAALDRVGLAALADRPFTSLSGGERQRALLARAVAQQAPLVVLDEPTNHLDVRAQLDLLDLVRALAVTTLAALHDLDQAVAYADQVVVLQEGRLVAAGPPLDVLTPDLIGRVFGVRAHVGHHPLTDRPHITFAPLPPRRTTP
jgi:iron complex transport system ATP-binding protein